MFGLFKKRRIRAVAFDIMGTVFPFDPLEPRLRAMGLPDGSIHALQAAATRDAAALAITGTFTPFPNVLRGALDQMLATHGKRATGHAKDGFIAAIPTLPARPDAKAALQALAEAKLPVIALTNGTAATTAKLLKNAGLDKLVRRVVSVDEVKRFKPAPDVYRHGARLLGVEPAALALVAAHPWDIHGAKAAGLATAYVSVEAPYAFPGDAPDLEAATLTGIAAKLVAAR